MSELSFKGSIELLLLVGHRPTNALTIPGSHHLRRSVLVPPCHQKDAPAHSESFRFYRTLAQGLRLSASLLSTAPVDLVRFPIVLADETNHNGVAGDCRFRYPSFRARLIRHNSEIHDIIRPLWRRCTDCAAS